MLDQIKHLGKHTLIYAIGSMVQALVGFILIPIYTRFLTPAQYGQLEIINTLILILGMILSFGFASAIMKVYERDCKNEEEKKETVGTMYVFVLISATLITLVGLFFAKDISSFILKDSGQRDLIYLAFLINIISVFLMLSFSVLRVREKSVSYILVSFLRFFLTLILNIYLIVKLNLGIYGILLGSLIAQLISGLFFIPIIFRYAKFSLSKRFLKKLFSFGLAIIPASIAMWIMDLSDRYFLQHFSNFTEVGIYSLGYKIGMVISVLLVSPFQLSWPTISFSLAKRSDVKEIYARVLVYFIFIGSFMALALSLFSSQIVKIIAPENFHRASIVVPLIAFSYVLYGIHFVLSPGLHLREKTRYYPLFVGIPAIINVILNFYFVPKYGMIGAALTTFICFVLMVVITYFVSNYFYYVKYEWGRILKLVFTLILALILGFWFDGLLWQKCLYNILILACFPAILYIIKFFRKGEIDQVLVILRKFKR